jgi:hypothetical protein
VQETMTLHFEIRPYEGVGSLRFGMSKIEVADLIGPPEEADVHPLGEAYEDRFGSSVLTIYSKADNTLVQIGFSRWTQGVTFKNTNIFNEDPGKVLEFLIQEDAQPLESLGIIVLLNLGITLTGFHDDGEDERTITVFAKGRWDLKKAKLKPFVLA